MRILVLILAITSVTFAATTVYLARQLSTERAQHPPAVPQKAVARGSPSKHAVPGPQVTAANPKSPAPAMAIQAAPPEGRLTMGPQMSEAEIKKMQAEYSRAFLAQLADPEQREELLAQRKMITRYSFPRLDQVLGLSSQEHARFLELFAMQQLEIQEQSARCSLDPGCSMQEAMRKFQDPLGQEINNLLGAERTVKFQQYQNTMGERESITQLRNRLPDTLRLNDGKAEQLISALAEEREEMHREAAQQGQDMHSFGMGAGMIYAPDNGGSFEERYAAARDNSQRLRQRAATYLNSEQLRIFNEMQDETLLSLRSAMRQKDGATGFSSVSVVQ
jgi:hypothetical protein